MQSRSLLSLPMLFIAFVGLALGQSGSGEYTGSELSPTYQYSYTAHATRLHSDLLAGYERAVPPASIRNPAQNYVSESGTDVNVQIRFFKVEAIQAHRGSMRLKIWFRLTWKDDRLAWNTSQYGGIDTLWFDGHDLQIWTPDITPYNTKDGFTNTLSPANAVVSSSGSVFWSRPGILDIMCKFSGLSKFPYDTLKCGMDVGGWIAGGGHQGITMYGGGYAFSSQEPTAGTSYQEYAVQQVNASVVLYSYACCPSDPYPVINYVIVISRASAYYFNLIMLPTVGLTLLSFGVFFMSFEVGERLGYGITLILALECVKIVVVDFVPVCGETLWVDQFLFINEVFALISLLETVLVLFLAYHEGDHILPGIFTPPDWVLVQFAWWAGMPSPTIRMRNTDGKGSVAGEIVQNFVQASGEPSSPGKSSPGKSPSYTGTLPDPVVAAPSGAPAGPPASAAGELPAGELAVLPCPFTLSPPPPKAADIITGSNSSPRRLSSFAPKIKAEDNRTFDRLKQVRPLTRNDHYRFVYFEKLFFLIDSDSNGYVKLAEMERLLQFLALTTKEDERLRVLQALDDEEDGLIQQDEFLQACILLLWDVPHKQLEWAASNFVECLTTKTDRNTAYWQKASKQVDRLARVYVISAYIICLGWVISLNLADDYDELGMSGTVETNPITEDSPNYIEPEMFSGMDSPVQMPNRVFALLLPIILVLLMFSVWMFQNYLGNLPAQKEKIRLEKVLNKVRDTPMMPVQAASPIHGDVTC